MKIPFLQSKIMNGAMDNWQRGTSFAAVAAQAYTADRWQYSKSGTVVHGIAQSADVPVNGYGDYSLYITTTTGLASPGATDFSEIRQNIEGIFLKSFKGKKMVLRFKVKATVAGTYCVAFKNAAGTVSLVKEYIIENADTWEEKTIRMQHDANLTWAYNTGLGMRVVWCLGAGSSFVASPDIWQNGNFNCTSNQVNLMAAGATFRLTDVVFVEDNEDQNRFPEYTYAGRDAIEELLLCQRYFEKSYNVDVTPGTASTDNSANYIVSTSTTAGGTHFPFTYQVIKRAVPSVTFYNPLTGAVGSANRAGTAIAVQVASPSSQRFCSTSNTAVTTVGGGHALHFTADAEL